MIVHTPQTIDVSRLPAPDIIDALDFETIFADFMARFIAAWDAERAIDPTLPAYDVGALEFDPAVILGQAYSTVGFLHRQKVNDVARAVLAPLARGADLDVVAARQNVARITVRPATDTAPALMETDESLLRRYLLSFDAASAGSRDAYLFRAFTAWPGMHDAAVIGRSIHGRRGDVDLVITGEGGAVPTTQQIAAVRAAVTAPHAKPEGIAVSVLPAKRVVYSVALVLEVPPGPDAEAVRAEAQARVFAATVERNTIGGSVPMDRIAGAAYGTNVLRVRRMQPLSDIVSEPYSIPVCGSLSVTVEVAE